MCAPPGYISQEDPGATAAYAHLRIKFLSDLNCYLEEERHYIETTCNLKWLDLNETHLEKIVLALHTYVCVYSCQLNIQIQL